jgi:hypothetical protein
MWVLGLVSNLKRIESPSDGEDGTSHATDGVRHDLLSELDVDCKFD